MRISNWSSDVCSSDLGTGYTGVELLRLLSQHPYVDLTAITSRKEDGMLVSDMFPNLRGRVNISFQTPEKAALEQCDVVFFATPHGVAMSQAQHLLEHNVRIIDLAADFRLQDTQVFERWRSEEHTSELQSLMRISYAVFCLKKK